MTNVCRIGGGCRPLPPNIVVKLITPGGKQIASFQTGLLVQTAVPRWARYSAIFTTPEDITTLVLTMQDITVGGCGNDFALDDITFRECIIPTPVVKAGPKPDAKKTTKQEPPVTKPVTEKTPVKTQPVKKDSPVIISKKIVKDTPVITRPTIPETLATAPLPTPLSTRENPLVKRIETTAGEIIIELYDNGQIDRDTVSVYHNNELIVANAGLSKRAISFPIKVDSAHAHHELIMVADNLGSIPPNTSMMVITTSNNRYEVFISSSEQKNAKVVIDLKE